MYIPNGPSISRDFEKREIQATLNVSAGFRKTTGKKAGVGILDTAIKPSIPSSLPMVKRNHRKSEMDVAFPLELERADTKNPRDTKVRERRKIKPTILMKIRISPGSTPRKKNEMMREIKGAEKTTATIDMNLERKITDFFTGKASMYSRDRFSLAPDIEELAGTREKIGMRIKEILTTDAMNLPIPEYPAI